MNTDDAQRLACKQLVEVITDYVEGVLPEPDQQRFEQHLAICPGCRNYVEQMRLTIRAVGRLTPESLPPDIQRRLLATFRNWKASR